MSTVRKVVGNPANGPGDVIRLALLVAQEARELGFAVRRIEVSRSGGAQPSRYLRVIDRHDREWGLRVANHYRPRNAPYAPPHFDLVALDGRSGLAEARRFLVAAAAGDQAWADHSEQGRCRRKRRRPNLKRLHHGRATA